MVTRDTRLTELTWSKRARGALFADQSIYEKCGHDYGDCRTWGKRRNCYHVRRLLGAAFGPIEVIAEQLGREMDAVTLADLASHVTRRELLSRTGVGKGTLEEIEAAFKKAGLRFATDARCTNCADLASVVRTNAEKALAMWGTSAARRYVCAILDALPTEISTLGGLEG